MTQREIKGRITSLNLEIHRLIRQRVELQQELRQSCGHDGGIVHWVETHTMPVDKVSSVDCYRCMNCGLSAKGDSLDQHLYRVLRAQFQKNNSSGGHYVVES